MKCFVFSYLICPSRIVFDSSKTRWIGLSFYFLPLWCSTSHFEEFLAKEKDGIQGKEGLSIQELTLTHLNNKGGKSFDLVLLHYISYHPF
jgi:hypothetical protein